MNSTERGPGKMPGNNDLDFFVVKNPSVWATAPDYFSFSSMASIAGCMRKWQLEHSTFENGKPYPKKPHPKAIEGEIVHEALEGLFKAVGRAGCPELDTEAFFQVVETIDVLKEVEKLLSERLAEVAGRPRAGNLRHVNSSQNLRNKVVTLFRGRYDLKGQTGNTHLARAMMQEPGHIGTGNLLEALKTKKILAEVNITHPKLPFKGIIDLIDYSNAGVRVNDFKTGAPHTSHKDQLMAYALLFWRHTGVCPVSVHAQYLAQQQEWPCSPSELEQVEKHLEKQILAMRQSLQKIPATASPGEVCIWCQVRQLCPEYWEFRANPHFIKLWKEKKNQEDVDLQGELLTAPTEGGCEIRVFQTCDLPLLWDSRDQHVFGPLAKGKKIRILGARFDGSGRNIRLFPWSEVFRLNNDFREPL